MRMKKTCLTAIMVFALLMLTVLPAKAKENMQLADFAELLSEQEEREIDGRLADLEERTGWDLMALTVDDAGGRDATSYAEAWFDEHTTRYSGVICAIDMDNREIVVRAFGDAMYYITDARTEEILDAGYEQITNEAYFATLQEMFHEVERAYLQEEPSRNYLYDEDTGGIIYYRDGKEITLSEILIALGLAVLAGGGTVGVIFGRYRLKFGGYKYPIEKGGRISLEVNEDRLVNSFVTTRQIPKPQSSEGSKSSTAHSTVNRSSGGRGTVHRSSGGRSTVHRSSSGGGRRSSGGGNRRTSSGGSRRF